MGNIFGKSSPPVNNFYNDHEEDDEFFEISLEDYISIINNETEQLSVADKLSLKDPNIKELILQWTDEQYQLKKFKLMNESNDFMKTLKYIGGLDISFPSNKDDLVHACACLVVLSYPELEIVYKQLKMVHLTSVYIPEYLAFREVEPLRELCVELKQEKPEYYPQLLLIDGNGTLHPKKFGIACHLGVNLDIPTVGVAKKLFHVDGLEKNDDFKAKVRTMNLKGDTFELRGVSGDLYGKVLKSTDESTNPIYVSIGHRISLDTAVSIVTQCCRVRVPEPIRWADILSREFIRENYVGHSKSCLLYEELNHYFLELSKLTQS